MTEAVGMVGDNLHVWESGGATSANALTEWVKARLQAHEAALAELLAVAGKRTVANTLAAYDRAVEQLNLAGSQAGVLNSVAADKAVRDAAQDAAQMVAQAGSALSLNRGVFDALVAMDLDAASPATLHYVERTLLGYRLSGVDKDAATRAELQSLHEKATMIALDFGRNIQEGTKQIKATVAELDGLPEDYLARHLPSEDGHVTLTTDQPDMQPVITFAHSSDLRDRMFLAYNTRAYPANQKLLLALLAVRQKIAFTLGFESWADLATADQMMGSARNVRHFLYKLAEASAEGAIAEHQQVLAFARTQQPELKSISMSSRGYWYEQFRRSHFDFDSQSVRPYFAYSKVEAGVLDTASKLFHVEFVRSTDLAWHDSVAVFDVIEKGVRVGRFYLDMHPREGKDKWFSAAPIVVGVRGGNLPEAALICNFPGGQPGDPGLLQYSDVVTYLHEFGHLMHAILGGQTEWVGLSGFATEGDFIEVPSQMLEEFFADESLLQSFAHHYQTGQPLPLELIRSLKRASSFGRADQQRAQLNYATLSLDLHDTDPETLDLDEKLRTTYQSFQPWTWIEGNRMYASFGHLTGYSSNYYTYLYDKVIALDFFAQFDASNLLGCEAASRYRKTVLEPGGSKPARAMVKDFLGREEGYEAFTAWLNEKLV